jgi:dihydropteroate synthase type 2
MVATFGIVNLTRDSFSDGGRFFDPEAAVQQAMRLHADGATVIDLGAESTHPDAEDVPAAEEIRRLQPVVRTLIERGLEISIDTRKPAVIAALAPLGVQWWNDVHGGRAEGALAVAAALPESVRFVLMFARSKDGRAERPEDTGPGLLQEIRDFAAERVAAFARHGIARERLVLDPGMGFFLGRTAAPSVLVLREIAALQACGLPLLVSVSRKSFLGELTGLPVGARGPATLAAELWAARHGVQFIRTHDVGAFRAAHAVEAALRGSL